MARRAWWLGGLLVLGGCDSAPPSAPDPVPLSLAAAATAAAGNLELAIGTPAMHSLGIVGGRMIITGAAGPAPMGLAASTCGPGRSAPTYHSPLTTHPFSGLIADSLFGRVFAYDAPSRSYFLSAAVNGPAQGVRFLLDALDDYGQPTRPPSQVGWLDLSDESAGGVFRMQARVHNGPATNADYVVTPAGSQSSYGATQAGWVAYGASSYPFTDSITAAVNTTSVVATVDSTAPGVHVTLRATRVTFDPADYRYDLDLLVRRGAESIRLVGTNDTYCFFSVWTVAVSMNDSALATYGRDANAVTVTPAAGRTLSDEQRRAITDLVDMQQLLFDWLQSLFLPVWRLLPP